MITQLRHQLAALLFALASIHCGGSSVFDGRSDAVFSPHGTAPVGAVAYSPDGNRYAIEIAPAHGGHIGIFDRANRQLVVTIEALPANNENDVKSLAWSASSNYLAVMYHGGLRPGITLYDARTGELVRYLGPGEDSRGFFHYMIFSGDDRFIFLSRDGDDIDARFPTGLEPQTSATVLPPN